MAMQRAYYSMLSFHAWSVDFFPGMAHSKFSNDLFKLGADAKQTLTPVPRPIHLIDRYSTILSRSLVDLS